VCGIVDGGGGKKKKRKERGKNMFEKTQSTRGRAEVLEKKKRKKRGGSCRLHQLQPKKKRKKDVQIEEKRMNDPLYARKKRKKRGKAVRNGLL